MSAHRHVESAVRDLPPTSPAPGLRPADLAEHRMALLRFARRRVRDEALAEDAVQDALVSALASMHSFQGQSAPRTWLIGILNHKIQDTFRREGRYVHLGGGDEDAARGEGDPSFDGDESDLGGDPLARVAHWQLGEALGKAIDGLPRTLRDVFQMQVLDGQSTGEVCDALGITETNCWVRLHRARKRLATDMQAHLSGC